MNKQELINKIQKHLDENEECLNNPYSDSDHEFTASVRNAEWNKAMKYAYQLDEPQKVSWRKAISVLEHHFQCEIPRNLDNVVKGYREMSGLMNSVEFELDKRGSKLTSKEFVLEALERYKQKVKVPLHVGNWIEYSKDEGWEFFRSIEEMTGPMGDGTVRRWFKKNSDKYAEAWSNDFEVEEEPKWKIINDQKYCLTSIEAGYGNSLHWAFDSTKKKPILFDNEETALYTAYITGGKVEKVLVR